MLGQTCAHGRVRVVLFLHKHEQSNCRLRTPHSVIRFSYPHSRCVTGQAPVTYMMGISIWPRSAIQAHGPIRNPSHNDWQLKRRALATGMQLNCMLRTTRTPHLPAPAPSIRGRRHTAAPSNFCTHTHTQRQVEVDSEIIRLSNIP